MLTAPLFSVAAENEPADRGGLGVLHQFGSWIARTLLADDKALTEMWRLFAVHCAPHRTPSALTQSPSPLPTPPTCRG